MSIVYLLWLLSLNKHFRHRLKDTGKVEGDLPSSEAGEQPEWGAFPCRNSPLSEECLSQFYLGTPHSQSSHSPPGTVAGSVQMCSPDTRTPPSPAQPFPCREQPYTIWLGSSPDSSQRSTSSLGENMIHISPSFPMTPCTANVGRIF